MTAISTQDLNLANYTSKTLFKKNIQSGVIAKIVDESPEKLLVGKTDVITLTKTPKAELVGEGQDKSPTPNKPGSRTVRTYKLQYTERFNEEVLMYDEDAQIGLIDGYVANLLKALSRGVDLVGFHGVNPLTGIVSGQAQYYVDQVATRVYDADAGKALDEAVATLLGKGVTANGIAVDPKFAAELFKLRNTDGSKKYPSVGLGGVGDNFEGLRSGQSNTVSGSEEMAAADATDLAIIGDFEALKYSVVRNVPVELIKYGDPDGLGDLKRKNQVALRGEIFFAAAVLDDDALVIITSDPTEEGEPESV